MRGDQVVVHVARMAGGVAQPVDAGDLGEAEEQPAEAPVAAVGPVAVPGVDVLAEERDLAHALVGEARGLGDDRVDRPRDFGAARVGDDAEGAELVAAFLDGEEGGDARAGVAAAGRAGRARRTCRRRRIRSRRPARPRRLGEKLGQAVVGLRADDEIDGRRAAHDLLAFGLRDAAGDADHHRRGRRARAASFSSRMRPSSE